MAVEIYEKNGIFGWITGLDEKYLNGVISSNFENEATIKEVIQFFQNKNYPWIWEVNPLAKPDNLEELLVKNGFILDRSYVTLSYDLTKQLAAPKPCDIREVTNEKDFMNWGIPLEEGFDSSADDSKRFIQLTAKIPYGDNQSFHHYALYHDDKPISCVTLSLSKFGARIDNLATRNSHLRQGFGKALTLFAMNKAKKLGYTMICLDASDEGLLLYKNIGFTEVYQHKTYEYKN